MIVPFLFSAVSGAVALAVTVWLGLPLWMVLAAWIVAGVVGLVIGAVLVALADQDEAGPDWAPAPPLRKADTDLGALEAGAGSVAPAAMGTAERSSSALARRLALGPDWQLRSARVPERMPIDLQLRLMDCMSYESSGPDCVWAEVRAWMIENDIALTVPPQDPEDPPAPVERAADKVPNHERQ